MATFQPRVAVVGLGKIAQQFHLPAWQSIARSSLIALCDVDAKKRHAAVTAFGGRPCVSLDDVLSDDAVNIVTLCTPNHLHYSQAMACLQAGKHVAVEKPLCVTAAEARRLAAYARRCGRVLMCLQHCRFRFETTAAARWLARQKGNDVYFCDAKVLMSRDLPHAAHYLRAATAGGGPLYDSGAHLIDLGWWLMGMPEPVSYEAMSWKINSSGRYASEDVFEGSIRFRGNKKLRIMVSYWSNTIDEVSCELHGSRGSVYWPSGTVVTASGRQARRGTLTMRPTPFASILQLKHFVNVIRGNAAPIIPTEQSARIVEFIEQLHLAAKSKGARTS